jgi:hypothetical protein
VFNLACDGAQFLPTDIAQTVELQLAGCRFALQCVLSGYELAHTAYVQMPRCWYKDTDAGCKFNPEMQTSSSSSNAAPASQGAQVIVSG